MLGGKRQRAKAGRITESNARPHQNILRVEAKSQRGQIGKTEAEWPADAVNRGKIIVSPLFLSFRKKGTREKESRSEVLQNKMKIKKYFELRKTKCKRMHAYARKHAIDWET